MVGAANGRRRPDCHPDDDSTYPMVLLDKRSYDEHMAWRYAVGLTGVSKRGRAGVLLP